MKRRSVLRGLVAAGGLSALSACLNLEFDDGSVSTPTGDPSRRPARQHAWNDFLSTDENGNHLVQKHHVYLSLSYDGQTRETDREIVETALTDLERAYEASNEGLLFTIGYSPTYFQRFDDPLDGVDLPPAGPLLPEENVATDDADAFLHLASDHASAVLDAETALFGDTDERGSTDATAGDASPRTDQNTTTPEDVGTTTANGVEVTQLDGVFSVAERRTGFFGPGLPAERDEGQILQGVPGSALDEKDPSFMGFWSRFQGSQATEDRVTIQEGRFAGGTTQHVSALVLILDNWVKHSLEEKIARLFAPTADTEAIGPRGERLTTDNTVGAVDEERLHEVADEHEVVGHAQKLSRFREGGRPPILRRDVSTDDNGEAGVMFVSLQRAFDDFRRLRLAMEGIDLAEETPVHDREKNGILQYFRTRRRGNFLIPPREMRALP